MDNMVFIFVAVLVGMLAGGGLVGAMMWIYQRQLTAPPLPMTELEYSTELKPPTDDDDWLQASAAPANLDTPQFAPPIPDVFSTLESVPTPEYGSAWLEGIGGMVAGQKITLLREENIMGRSRVCDIQFHDPKVSRQHAMIRLYRGHYFLQDMQSSRGTLVNSQPIQTHLLKSGDQIRLGDTVLVFHLPA